MAFNNLSAVSFEKKYLLACTHECPQKLQHLQPRPDKCQENVWKWRFRVKTAAEFENRVCILTRSFTTSDKNSLGSLPWQTAFAQSASLFVKESSKGRTTIWS